MKVYHNPRWGKSRKTLEILQCEGIKYKIIEYLKTPLNKRQIKSLLGKLDLNPHDLVRRNNSLYKELKISSFKNDGDKIISILASYPELLERPIVEITKKAVIARPPENIYSLL